MIRRILLASLLIIVPASAIRADDPCPCIPLSYMWTVIPCDTWDCTMSYLVASSGDSHVFALPTTTNAYKWVVLKRVPTGTAVISPDAPFLIERFSKMSEAETRFDGIEKDRAPLLVTAADGNVLIVYLRQAEHRRAVGH